VKPDEESSAIKVDFAPGNPAKLTPQKQLLLGHEKRLYADAPYRPHNAGAVEAGASAILVLANRFGAWVERG
jgi:hypothetical protein